MKKSLFYFILLCLLFGLMIPKLYISMKTETSGNKVVNSVRLPDNSIKMLDYLVKEHLNNVELLVFNDTFLLDKANSSLIAGISNNGYKLGMVVDLSAKDNDYFKKLSDVLAGKSVHIIYFQDKNSQFDYGTFNKITDLSKKNDATIGLLENEQQNGLQYPELKEYSSEVESIVSRALYTESKVIKSLDDTEVSLRLLRSVVDRGIRLNLLEADSLETLKRYDNILEELNHELIGKGYGVSSSASPLTVPESRVYNLFIVVAFITVTMLWFQESAGLKKKSVLYFTAVFLSSTLILYFVDHSLAMIFLTLIITILVPSFVTIILYKYLTGNSCSSSFLNILKLSGLVFLAYITSGLFIWLAFSDYIFRMGFITYKLAIISYISPIIIILIYLLKHEGYEVDNIKKALCTRKSVAIMLLSAAAAAVYLSRSGNFSLFPALPAELYLRMLLERIMPARPRLKEFLIGYPAFFLLFAVSRRRNKTVFNYLIIFSAIAGISVLNTFCHSFTSVYVSLTRAFLGFLLGTITGAFTYYIFKTYFSDRTW